MGFGTLLIGYLFSLNFVSKQGIFFGISSLIMLYAMTRLYTYNHGFRYAFYTAIPMSIVAVLSFVMEVLSLFCQGRNIALTWCLTVHPIFMAFFTYYILTGIIEMAKEVGIIQIMQRATVQRFLGFIFYVPFIFLNFSNSNVSDSVVYFRFIVITYIILSACGIIYMLMNAKLIFSCYMWICMPKDVDMEKKSRKENDRITNNENDQKHQGGKRH